MKLTIEGSVEEIKKVLPTIVSGQEHVGDIDVGKTEETKDSNAATL
jgi:hypothetical protein